MPKCLRIADRPEKKANFKVTNIQGKAIIAKNECEINRKGRVSAAECN